MCKVFSFVLFLSCGIFQTWVHAGASIPSELHPSIFKIMVTSQSTNEEIPWEVSTTESKHGSGFYIGEGKIITNAHVVKGARFILVQHVGDSIQKRARLRLVAHDYDLAVIELDDKKYTRRLKPLQFAPLPKLQSKVTVVGYPLGGTQVSMTNGIISRIDFNRYVHSEQNHLLLQTDAAINPGNSGGPVLQSGKVVGVAFQSMKGVSNISYCIPASLVLRVLRDLKHPPYDGYIEHGIVSDLESLNNPGTRAFFQLEPKEGGILVHDVLSTSPYAGSILPMDVLLSIDHHPIDSEGMVVYEGQRVRFEVLFDEKQVGETVVFLIKRSGEKKKISVVLRKDQPQTFLKLLHILRAPYLVYGGLVFRTLTSNYLMTHRGDPFALLFHFHTEGLKFLPKDILDIVILAQQLPSSVQPDTELALPKVVKTVNGTRITSLAQVAQILDNEDRDEILVEFYHEEAPLVLSKKEIMSQHQAILKKYGIPSDRSLELSSSEEPEMLREAKVHP